MRVTNPIIKHGLSEITNAIKRETRREISQKLVSDLDRVEKQGVSRMTKQQLMQWLDWVMATAPSDLRTKNDSGTRLSKP